MSPSPNSGQVCWTRGAGIAIYQAEVPSGTTSVDDSIALSANPFAAGRFHVSTIPVANLSATTKVGSGKQPTAASTTATAMLATSAGGAVFCLAADMSIKGGNSGSFSGDETFTTRYNTVTGGGTMVVSDAAADAASGCHRDLWERC